MIRNTTELYAKMPWARGYPNMTMYILRFGIDDLIPIPWIAKDANSAEKIYEQCVKAGQDWRSYLNIDIENEAL